MGRREREETLVDMVSLGSQVSLDLEARQWAQTSQDTPEILACPV